jgi:hypothetical protein
MSSGCSTNAQGCGSCSNTQTNIDNEPTAFKINTPTGKTSF